MTSCHQPSLTCSGSTRHWSISCEGTCVDEPKFNVLGATPMVTAEEFRRGAFTTIPMGLPLTGGELDLQQYSHIKRQVFKNGLSLTGGELICNNPVI